MFRAPSNFRRLNFCQALILCLRCSKLSASSVFRHHTLFLQLRLQSCLGPRSDEITSLLFKVQHKLGLSGPISPVETEKCCRTGTHFAQSFKIGTVTKGFDARLANRLFLPARRYASAVLAVVMCLSVCLSVRLSVRHKPALYQNV